MIVSASPLYQLFQTHHYSIRVLPMSRRIFSQVQQDDDNDYGSRAALPISKTKAELVNGQPISGEDYLLLVR